MGYEPNSVKNRNSGHRNAFFFLKIELAGDRSLKECLTKKQENMSLL